MARYWRIVIALWLADAAHGALGADRLGTLRSNTVSVPGSESARAEQVLFFFQAEDGIRDGTVTGVQTCALPISAERRPAAATAASRRRQCRRAGHRRRRCGRRR